ncbi:MAG: glucose/arabinose dehydrogenase [Flavobacteriaceae bacterium]|jgi:glucose/arabinose dehydrogenase
MRIIISTLLFLFFANLSAQDIEIELFKNGFSSPVDLQNAGDDRLFVVEQGGRIKILQSDGTINPNLYLNISSQVSSGSEQGLLGLAFHPDYANNGYYYVNYTKTNGDSRISRFSVDPSDPDSTLSGSELTIIEYDQPFSNHNGGGIAFGGDGYLYIAVGDGGNGGDPGNRAQNTTILLGKLLRIDIDNTSTVQNYSIPTDNPFAGSTVDAEEIWAYGLRNPWRFSFDSLNQDLWIGDVGQQNVEEIDRAGSTEAGLNYGWRCYEGSAPFNTGGCPPMQDLKFPIAEYSSSSSTSNCSITGGYVYRGSIYPAMEGLYFFADVCSGLIGTVDALGNLTDHGDFNGSWVSFGVDVNEELYIVNIGGSIFRVIDTAIIGTSEFDNPLSIVMTPNPATENLNILVENDQIRSISIVDIKGSLLLKEDNLLSSSINLDVSSLSQGFYIVKITSVNGNFNIKKLIVK